VTRQDGIGWLGFLNGKDQMSTIRVLLADDHGLVRAGIRALLESLDGVSVVAEAANGREALRLVEILHPDLALIDIAMSELNGLETTQRITREYPNTRVIILSMHANEEYVLQALKAGASGYLLKDAFTTELEMAIQAVSMGETYLSPPVSKHVIAGYMRRIGGQEMEEETPMTMLDRLTPRQREILQLIAEGYTTQEIAQKLNISTKTAETHRTQLMDRLDIHDIAGLVRYAIRVGMISLDE
jgi:DNA-binding NarL/FixJ family response regulator